MSNTEALYNFRIPTEEDMILFGEKLADIFNTATQKNLIPSLATIGVSGGVNSGKSTLSHALLNKLSMKSDASDETTRQKLSDGRNITILRKKFSETEEHRVFDGYIFYDLNQLPARTQDKGFEIVEHYKHLPLENLVAKISINNDKPLENSEWPRDLTLRLPQEMIVNAQIQALLKDIAHLHIEHPPLPTANVA